MTHRRNWKDQILPHLNSSISSSNTSAAVSSLIIDGVCLSAALWTSCVCQETFKWPQSAEATSDTGDTTDLHEPRRQMAIWCHYALTSRDNRRATMNHRVTTGPTYLETRTHSQGRGRRDQTCRSGCKRSSSSELISDIKHWKTFFFMSLMCIEWRNYVLMQEKESGIINFALEHFLNTKTGSLVIRQRQKTLKSTYKYPPMKETTEYYSQWVWETIKRWRSKNIYTLQSKHLGRFFISEAVYTCGASFIYFYPAPNNFQMWQKYINTTKT